MGVTVDMNGVPLAQMSQAGALTLNTAGKYVAGNIGVQYTGGGGEGYKLVSATVEMGNGEWSFSGTLTVAPYTVATYTAGASAAAFTVAVGAGTTGTARDCELVIDCTGSGAVAPTVTWPSNFHPRTDAATDFACEAGVRNVYFISEYATGEFTVGGWQETAGGNA